MRTYVVWCPDLGQEQILAEVEAEDTLGAHRVQIGSGRPQ